MALLVRLHLCRRGALACVVGALLCGCGDPMDELDGVPCTKDSTCAAGKRCVANRCVPSGDAGSGETSSAEISGAGAGADSQPPGPPPARRPQHAD